MLGIIDIMAGDRRTSVQGITASLEAMRRIETA
jgi:hypothetical protein